MDSGETTSHSGSKGEGLTASDAVVVVVIDVEPGEDASAAACSAAIFLSNSSLTCTVSAAKKLEIPTCWG